MTWFDNVLFGALPLDLFLVPRVPCGAASQLLVVAGDLVWYIRLPTLVVYWPDVIRISVLGLLCLGVMFVVAGGLVGSLPFQDVSCPSFVPVSGVGILILGC